MSDAQAYLDEKVLAILQGGPHDGKQISIRRGVDTLVFVGDEVAVYTRLDEGAFHHVPNSGGLVEVIK